MTDQAEDIPEMRPAKEIMGNHVTDYVGHKTFSDGQGGFRHEPLTREEGEKIWRQREEAEEIRARDMPTERDALSTMFEAHQRLKELGWNDAIYCPKDGSVFDVIEAGSTGIHPCSYDGEWPKGSWWIHDEGDLWPSRPILFRKQEGPKDEC